MTLKPYDPKTLHIYCDGGARGNPGPAAIGFVVKSSEGKILHQHSQRIGEATNNVAEYKAVIAALGWIGRQRQRTENQYTPYTIFLDSRLVVNQLSGKFKVKDEKLKDLIIQARRLEKRANLTLENRAQLFSSNPPAIRYVLIPREQNSEADALVNEALDTSPTH